MKKVLLVVDYQFDFADPNGKLYVDGGETLKKGILERIADYKSSNDYIVFSGDFHPNNHVSFDLWGKHCLVDQNGSNFYVDASDADLIIKKGTDRFSDSYSAFYVSENVESTLNDWLIERNVNFIEICGLALDVCVKETYLDAKKFGYNSIVNENLCKPLDKNFKFIP